MYILHALIPFVYLDYDKNTSLMMFRYFWKSARFCAFRDFFCSLNNFAVLLQSFYQRLKITDVYVNAYNFGNLSYLRTDNM